MKKMKFRKLSRVLISISLLAIIAVSLISVPVSAATESYDDIVGYWRIKDNFNTDYSYINTNNEFGVFCKVPYLISNDSEEILYFEAEESAFVIYNASDDVVGLIFSPLAVGSNDPRPTITFYADRISYGFSGGSWVSIYSDHPLYEQLRIVEFTSPNITNYVALSPGYYYNNLLTFAEPYVPPQPRSLLDNILGTFSEVGSWIGTIVSSLVALFWSVETASLTFLGILSVAGLAFSVIMLLFGFVTRFVGFSG